MMDKIYINTDGGSRGNPGPCGIGVVFFDAGEKIFFEQGKCIGHGTNNDAEYQAIIEALKILKKSTWFLENNIESKEVECRLDSKLVVEQVNGRFKVKQPHIAKYVAEIRELLVDLKLKISFNYVPREQNKDADRLVNSALDAAKEI